MHVGDGWQMLPPTLAHAVEMNVSGDRDGDEVFATATLRPAEEFERVSHVRVYIHACAGACYTSTVDVSI